MVPLKNRRRALGILALVIVLGVGIAWFLLGPGEAPVDQPPLITLNSESLQAIRDDFNRDVSHARVIVLLSPT
jgi:hypothetical protein